MNVSCPECRSVFRVDPAKVPADGVQARCTVCGAVMMVAPESSWVTEPVVQAPAAPAGVGATSSPPGPQARAAGAAESVHVVSDPSRAEPVARPAVPAPAPQAVPPDVRPRPVNPYLNNTPELRARRLARALVSDLVAYNPQKREQGLRDGTLRQLFRDEIRKSWEEYVEQVGASVAESTPHFQDALNDVLAGGRRVF